MDDVGIVFDGKSIWDSVDCIVLNYLVFDKFPWKHVLADLASIVGL